MKDEYLKYGFYVEGIYRALSAAQMQDRRVIRWIKNRGVSLRLPYSQIGGHCTDFLRDAPIIIVRKRKRDGKWIEAALPTCRALDCDVHFYEDFFRPVPMDILPRLPRPEARLRVWTLGTILRAEWLYEMKQQLRK